MKNDPFFVLRRYSLLVLLLCCSKASFGQPSTLPSTPMRDTASDKTNDGKWKNREAIITYRKLNSVHILAPDTSIHTYHRRPFIQPWVRDMGNPGSPSLDLMFTPENRVGPTLGYTVFNAYRFHIDSLNYYTTDRPYSVFSYQAAGRQEHVAGILHTQNIKPNWNFALEYRKITAPGYYQIQRNNHDNFALTTNYKSLNKHYTMHAAMVYNKQQHDENGGINDTDLYDPALYDRRTINANYRSSYSSTRSAVSNVQRDFTIMMNHAYTWGITDTLFDDRDTAAYTYTLTPRFGISFTTTVSTEKHTYKDLAPDSMRYLSLFNQSFTNEGSGYYAAGNDSVLTQQKWFWAYNKLMFNGFLGNQDNQLHFSAGTGIRYDQFTSDPVGFPIPDSPYFKLGIDRNSLINNYLEGTIKKEALTAGAWEYGINTRFFYAGKYDGNFTLNAMLGKKLNRLLGSFIAGYSQNVGSAPFSLTNYRNRYTSKSFGFNREGVSTLYATIDVPRYRLYAGIRAHIISNYIYLGKNELPAQYNAAFTIPQAWVRKVFKAGHFYLDNELVFQLADDNLPVNIPRFMGRHQFSYEQALFKNAIKIATGLECRYNSSYKPAGYSAQFNRFFYQDYYQITNYPELSAFLNFRIKRFRAFIIGENLQTLFGQNNLLFTGTPVINYKSTGNILVPVYATPGAILRFGFAWAMVN